MRAPKPLRSFTLLAAVLPALVFAGSASADTLIGLTSDNQLIQFESATPGSPGPATSITGLPGGESIVGIDFRPASRQLYGLGLNGLYTIDPATGAATQIGAPFAPPLNGASFGVDFNPVADRLRVVSDAGQNLRINPNDGTAEPDGNLAFGPGDPNFGQNPSIGGVAHTNNVAGATSTIVYGIDFNLDVLVMLNPSTGQLTTVGGLGVNPGSLLGFDVAAGSGDAYFVAGSPGVSFFHRTNLTTGSAPSAGNIPASNLRGLAAVTPPGSGELPEPGPEPTPDLLGCPPAAAQVRNLIVLTDGDDTATGTDLGDLIFAGRGDDIVNAGAGADCVDLGPGADVGRGGTGNDFLPGGTGNDRLVGRIGHDRISGGSGRDRIRGGPGRDRLLGGSSADRVSGRSGRDRIRGGPGGDRLSGGGAADRISGGSGNDRIAGGAGRDRISGGPGDDRISTRDGDRDRINCGGGDDRVFADSLDRVSRSCE